jgi:hypothetical protein
MFISVASAAGKTIATSAAVTGARKSAYSAKKAGRRKCARENKNILNDDQRTKKIAAREHQKST